MSFAEFAVPRILCHLILPEFDVFAEQPVCADVHVQQTPDVPAVGQDHRGARARRRNAAGHES